MSDELVRPGRECKKCGENRRAEMRPDALAVDGHRTDCRACDRKRARARRAANPEYERAWRGSNPHVIRAQRLRKYGMTLPEYEELLALQGGACAVCRRPPKPGDRALSVDHDHRCCPGTARSCGRCVRGLLCAACNTCLGLMRDDPDLLRAAIRYLEDYR